MTNKQEILELLNTWAAIVKDHAKNSRYNSLRFYDKNETRIKLTSKGNIPVYNYPTYKKQCIIQNELCRHLPDLKNLITSVPDILDFEWKIEDYIELYYYHYNLVIQKIREKLND